MEASIYPSLILSLFLLVLLLLGVPIAFALCTLGIVACLLWIGSGAIMQIVQTFYGTCSSDILLCLPLFLFMAEVVVVAGIGEDLFNSIKIWTGRVRGGIAAATVVGCGMFAAVSGSSTATIAAVGVIALMEMLRLGYKKSFASGTVGVGGTLGVMIPPSIIMILYGALADQSIGKLFIAGVVPGMLMALGFVIVTLVQGYLRPESAPISTEKLSFARKMRVSRSVIPFVLIFLTMFYAFYTGIATPTEVAALGVLASVCIGLAMRRLNLAKLFEATKRAGLTTAFVLFIIAGAKFFTFTVSATGVSDLITQSITGMGLGPIALVLVMMAVYLVMGCFIDPAGMLTLTIPFFLPALVSANVDLIWFGVLATLLSEIGYCTPPFGFNLFVLKGVAPPEVAMSHIVKGVLPFLVVDFLLLVLLVLFPDLVLWLPSKM
ncbi:MAG: TRAP transporter large permease subunit [Proteobacteria bacterium]|nr:TRAP transporter large permease subunit [Pseudomonadota bacterium]MBU4574913.1 TRAP transporter large permease subunit [Pseudomonadota bacterium]MBU4597103.1 TRAP transporter large permease subunit [Pseudomonadota bacterium]MBV1715345.1 TRAP transporter large permease subunit [Desulfarculus sp.]